MRLIVFLAVLISVASYAGFAPGFAMIVGLPMTFAAGAIITVSMIYVLAKAG